MSQKSPSKVKDASPENPSPTAAGTQPLAPVFTYKGIRQRIRTINGQVALMGGAIAGGFVLAVAAVVCRPWFFDPYICQRFSDEKVFAGALQKVAEGQPPGSELKENPKFQDAVYQTLVAEDLKESEKANTLKALDFQSPRIVDSLRITAAAGSASQKERALVLAAKAAVDWPDVVKVVRHIEQQAARGRDPQLLEAARDVLNEITSQNSVSERK